MKKICTILLTLTLSLLTTMAQNFSIDLTQDPAPSVEGVTQVSYPQNGASYNGAQHGWCWYAFTFQAEGPVRITLGGCQYTNAGYEGYVEKAGVRIGEIANKTAGCYHQDPSNSASYVYTGEAAELTVYCGQYCPFVQVETVDLSAPVIKERKLYSTNFQDWDDAASSTTASTKTVTTSKSNETLTFTWAETQIASTGTNAKFTNTEVITSGYAMAAKTATPYIETSALASVTKVEYVHAATGGSRGWGLLAKGDGDTTWDTIHTAFCEQAGTKVEVEVNKTNCQLRWYNLNGSQNAYMTSMAIYGNVEEAPRTFENFEIDMTGAELDIPASVELVSDGQHTASLHDSSHGWQWVALKVVVDGPVKFTIGGCQYTNVTAEVRSLTKDLNGDGLLQDLDRWWIDTKIVGCYHNGGVAEWVYNYEEPDTLIIYTGEYCPYIKAEACDYIENVTVAYFDQNGTKLGEEEVAPGTAFEALFSIEDLPTIAAGKAFRGWYTAEGIKAPAVVSDNLILYAKVTDIEEATVGTHYVYDLTKASFYMEDHELISATGKQHGSGHGFVFNAGQEMTLVVSPKAYVSVGLCTYTNTSDQVIRNAAGDSVAVMHVIRNGEDGAIADGAICSFYNDNVDANDTLHFNFTTTSYIHSVEVYNVAAPLVKTGHVYDIAAGDAATLMMVCNILEDGDTIQLHDGIYDLGETVLTTISASNIVVRGESMSGTIIKNAPDAKLESINGTATIVNTGNDNVYELLTLQNALDYYKANNGRAVAFWDKGDRTACYNVRLLSYQDTYYSNKPGQQCWWEDCEIHGTVDYICGSGSIYFYNTLLYCEKRSSNGGGSDCITANNSQTAREDKGYVFDRCVIKSECPTVSLSRSWNDQPQVAYLLTVLDTTAGNFHLTDGNGIQRWTIAGMNNCVPYDFAEYKTMDMDGNVVSPESNVVKFFSKDENAKETIIGYEAAEAKSYVHFFRDGWTPARNYVAFPEEGDPEPEGIVVPSVKTQGKVAIENGQIVIMKGDKRYTILGQQK